MALLRDARRAFISPRAPRSLIPLTPGAAMTDHRLAPEQLRFFETFGFLAFPGLLGDCIDEIIEAFEAVWAGRGGGHHGAPHDGEQRSCIVPFIDQHPRLCALLDDGRIEGLLSSLIGPDFNYVGSDGNYYAGDTRWHSDGWGRRLRFVKVALYLDPLTRDTGCLRVIPGSHHLEDGFAGTVQEHIREIPETWGMEARDLPCLPLETKPGDVLVFNHNLKHAAFGGSARRRMFTINCSQRFPEEELPALREYIAVHARFWIDRVYGDTMMETAGPGRMVHLEQVRANDGHLAGLAARQRKEMAEPARG